MHLTRAQKLKVLASAWGMRGDIKSMLSRRFWQGRKTWDQDYCGVQARFHTDDFYSNYWFYGPKNLTVAHEPVITKLLIHLAGQSKYLWDIGSNLGYFAVVLGKKNPDLRIMALEMDETLLPVIQRNLETNGVNAEIVHGAVGETDEIVSYTPHPYSFLQKMAKEKATAPALQLKTPIMRMDALARDAGALPDLIKIDVDGAEVAALRAASDVLANPELVMFLEVHPKLLPQFGVSISDVDAILQKQGLRIYEIENFRTDAAVNFAEVSSLETGIPQDSNPMVLVTRKDPKDLFAGL